MKKKKKKKKKTTMMMMMMMMMISVVKNNEARAQELKQNKMKKKKKYETKLIGCFVRILSAICYQIKNKPHVSNQHTQRRMGGQIPVHLVGQPASKDVSD